MSLFDVPGWTVLEAPVAEGSTSRKRKRKGADTGESASKHAAMKNVEKILATLGDTPDAGGGIAGVKKRKTKAQKEEATDALEPEVLARLPWPRRTKGEKSNEPKGARVNEGRTGGKKRSLAGPSRTDDAPSGPPKKQKRGQDKDSASSQVQAPPVLPKPSPSKARKKSGQGLTALQADMKSSLDGARFRWINETLYKASSESAHDMMREDPSIFSEYHAGFRHQVQTWPANPVAHYISTLSLRPAGTVIVDLGCGDASLARALVPKGLVMLSYDLVPDGGFVVEADVCKRVPLPGAETEDEEGAHIVDVVVCALSLMSVNWVGCVREAWRILKAKGELHIAEVTSRFTDMEAFVSLVSAVGFKLRSKDESNSHFTLFEFTKIPRKSKNDKEWEKLMTRGSVLKACEYKRR